MNLKHGISLLFYALVIVAGRKRSPSIRTMVILFRHGDRTPTASYPGDPYKEYFDIRGRGNLTTRGCQRLYRNGRHLAKLFPQIKKAKLVQPISDSNPRCIKSIKCLNNGLTKRKVLRPIVTSGPILDHVKANCPRRNYSIHYDPLFRTVYDKHQGLIHNLSQITNYSFTVVNTNSIGYKILDPILSEYLMHLPMPSWFTPEFKKEAFSYNDDNFNALGHLYIENKLSGLFLQELIDKMRNSSGDQMSLYVYSSHDATLGPVMVTVNAWMGRHPNYGESLIFTMDSKGQMQVFYLDQNHKLTQHVPFGCQVDNCTLGMFASGVAHFIPENLDDECRLD